MSSHMTIKVKEGKYPLELPIQFFSQSTEDKLGQQIKDGFAELKKLDELRKKEIEEQGKATSETKNQMDEIKDTLKGLQEKLDKLSTENNRAFAPNGQKSEDELKRSAAFFSFMRKGKAEMAPEERKALVEDEDGLVIVPEELDREIERELPKLTIFRPLVNTRNTSAAKIRKRGLNEVTVGWGKIETSASKKLGAYESELTPSERYIFVENLNGLTKIGNDELEDTDVQLQQYLGSSFALAAAGEEDKAVLVGKGHSMEEPEGVLVAANVKRIDTEVVGAVTADDIINLFYGVKAQYRKNGIFVIPSSLEQQVRKLKNANGDYIWQAALTAGTPNLLLGRPVYNQDDFPAFAPGADQAVFGDFKVGYTLADRKGSSIQRLNELYAEDDLVGFKYKKRVGGGVDKPEAFAVLRIKA